MKTDRSAHPGGRIPGTRPVLASVLTLLLAFLAAGLAPSHVSAQGALLVRVTGPAGQPLENATVTVASQAGVLRTGGTNERGQALVPGLAAGTY
ncbi:MAG: carboxypeptidase-like regulatory domain-containing protein, partial [Gemmatimonadetes bacterium]|nr:carboxypeptidase-like regulatory domain-containing protein [Gemmatimonadota bacterium]